MTEETKKGGEIVNEERKKNKLKELELIFASLIFSKNNENIENLDKNENNNNNNVNKNTEKISSSYLRKGIISLINIEDLDYLLNIFTLYNSYFEISNEKSIKWFSKIRDLYSQSWRKYHSLNHIIYLLKSFENINKGNKELIKDKISVFYSIIFHDIIYTPSRNDNEEVIKIKNTN